MSTDDMFRKLELACVASCGCLTKTPDFQYHAADCRYRVLNEAIAHITDQCATIANQAQMSASDSLRLLDKGVQIGQLEKQLASYRASAEAEIAHLREQLSASLAHELVSQAELADRETRLESVKAERDALLQPVTSANYGPTLAADINALPDRLRRYVHDLETRADPTWDLRRAFAAEENAVALNNLVEELQQYLAALRTVPVAVDHDGALDAEDLAALKLCDDCPPPGYPSDKTRCASCPRRADSIQGASNV